MDAQQNYQFATTRWSLIQAVGSEDSSVKAENSRDALAQLCQTYWFPVYAHVRRRFSNPVEAEDLTQAFFARLLDGDTIQAADRNLGRFRTYLLTVLDHFLTNEWHRAQAQKRGGQVSHYSLNLDSAESRLSLDPSTPETAETEFERRWALALLESAFAQLREEQISAEKQQIFDALRDYLMSPERVPQAELAAQLGMSAGTVKVNIHRLKKRFGQLLRDEIAHTVASVDEIDDEIRRLQAALSRT